MATAIPDDVIEPSHAPHLAGVLWLLVGVACLVIGTGYDVSQFALSVAMIAFGVWFFCWHGVSTITAAGLWSLAAAVFIGYAGIWQWQQVAQVGQSVHAATALAYFSSVAMTFFWPQVSSGRAPVPYVEPAVSAWGFWMGAVATLAVLAASIFTGETGTVIVQAGVAAFALLTISLVVHRPSHRTIAIRLSVVAGLLAVYSETLFTGYGRLNIAALGLSALIALAVHVRSRAHKYMIVALVVPALVVFSQMRERFGEETYGVHLSGIGSVTLPLSDFGRLITLHGQDLYAAGRGDTFIATALFWVPRDLWPGKPVGFGAVLTHLISPNLDGTGQSRAALSIGEWYYDFGIFGVVAMIPTIALFIRLLDRKLADISSRALRSRRDLLCFVVVIIVVADMPNLLWGGSFGFLSRTAIRLATLVAVGIFAARTRQPNQQVTSALR